jgi:hypothetical protein
MTFFFLKWKVTEMSPSEFHTINYILRQITTKNNFPLLCFFLSFPKVYDTTELRIARNFFSVLRFELWAWHFAKQILYHLSHASGLKVDFLIYLFPNSILYISLFKTSEQRKESFSLTAHEFCKSVKMIAISVLSSTNFYLKFIIVFSIVFYLIDL